jgi:DNA-binding transcriptional LysR family regulator
VLLHLDDPSGPFPWLSWSPWLQAAGVAHLKPAGSLGFNYYDQLIRATLAGHGIALGRRPLVSDLVADGSLVEPFSVITPSDRAYHVVSAEFARGRPHVARFVEWLLMEAKASSETRQPAVEAKRRRTR